jgi:uncharacterized protein (DUF1810 family)
VTAENDLFKLQRFIDAQAGVYEDVVRELGNGRKTSHWMWFVFPQIVGLGYSSMSRTYAITGCEEAAAYAGHPVLGERLRHCTALVNAIKGRTAHDIFDSPDDMKFRSCMTLFARCAAQPEVFRQALLKYFDETEDALTVAKLSPR